MQNGGLALTWNGSDWVSQEGSDTEGSDDGVPQHAENPLSPSEQVVAILNADISSPPPLPVLRKHARSTACAVIRAVLGTPKPKRTKAQKFALTLPLCADTVSGWVEQQFEAHRREHTLKTALVMALNPTNTGAWARKQTGARVGHMYIIKGLALHLRMHPFTRPEVQYACSMLLNYEPKVRRSPDPSAIRFRCSHDAATLEAAVILVLFQRYVRLYA